jgi:hypothetical protein
MKHVILLLLFPAFLFAQEKAKVQGKLEGTYQIEFLKSAKAPIAVTGEILEKIESLRAETKVTYLVINEDCRIMILPKNDLSVAKREKLEEFIIVEKFTN